MPAKKGLKPSYEQKAFPLEKTGQLHLVASPEGREGSLVVHQDVDLRAGRLAAGDKVTHALKGRRVAWLQVIEGSVNLNGTALEPGDGAAVSEETLLSLSARSKAEVLLFDMAA